MPTQQQLAAHLDLSDRQIRDLQGRGVFRKGADFEEARVSYIRHLREQAAGRTSASGLDLTAERARLAAAQANKVERENLVAEQALIAIEDAIQAMSEVISTAKSKLMILPELLAPLLVKTRTIPDAQKILADSINESLEELSKLSNWNPDESTAEESQPEG